MRSTGQPADFSPPLLRSNESSQNHYFETILLADQAFSSRFKTVGIYFASHSPLTAPAVLILPWKFPVWSSEPNQICIYHSGTKRLREAQLYFFAYVRDWQPELGQHFIRKCRGCSRRKAVEEEQGPSHCAAHATLPGNITIVLPHILYRNVACEEPSST